MDPFCLVSLTQAAGGVKVWGIFSWHTLGPLVPTEYCLTTPGCLSIVADHVHPIILRLFPASCGKTQNISNWFFEHDNEFTVLHSHQISIR